MAAAPIDPALSPGPLRRWIIEHDDSRAFLVGYVALSIILTLWIGLFWLIALVALHFAFETVKKHHDGARGASRLAAWAAWDIKFDLLLITIALVLLVFTSVSFGVAGLAGLGQISLFGVRLGGLASGLRALLPLPLKDLFLATRILCVRKLDRLQILNRRRQTKCDSGPARSRATSIASAGHPWHTPWTFADKLALLLILVNLGTIGLGIALAEQAPGEILARVAEQLHPWPGNSHFQ